MKLAGIIFFVCLILSPVVTIPAGPSPTEFEERYLYYSQITYYSDGPCDLTYTTTRFYWWSLTTWNDGATVQINRSPTAEIIRFGHGPSGPVALCGIYKDKGKVIVWRNSAIKSGFIEQLILLEGYKIL